MRINVYAEELTAETALVTKDVTDDEFGTRTFYGVRVYLDSPSSLHHSEEDDDRSAITFWVKANKEGTPNANTLSTVLLDLHTLLYDAQRN